MSGTILGIVALAWTWARRSLGIPTPVPGLEVVAVVVSALCAVLGIAGVAMDPGWVNALVMASGLSMVLVVVALAVGHWQRLRSL